MPKSRIIVSGQGSSVGKLALENARGAKAIKTDHPPSSSQAMPGPHTATREHFLLIQEWTAMPLLEKAG